MLIPWRLNIHFRLILLPAWCGSVFIHIFSILRNSEGCRDEAGIPNPRNLCKVGTACTELVPGAKNTFLFISTSAWVVLQGWWVWIKSLLAVGAEGSCQILCAVPWAAVAAQSRACSRGPTSLAGHLPTAGRAATWTNSLKLQFTFFKPLQILSSAVGIVCLESCGLGVWVLKLTVMLLWLWFETSRIYTCVLILLQLLPLWGIL